MTPFGWVDGLTIGDVFDRVAERFPDRDAVVFPQIGYRRTYSAFRAEVDTAARALLALGVGRGEKVGVWATNWPRWVVLQFATAKVGAVLVNVNPAYRASELAYVLDQADIAVLFLTDQFKTSRYFDILAEARPTPTTFPKLRHVVSIKAETGPGIRSWDDFLADRVNADDLVRRSAEGSAEEVANIQYTSGTTGFPKGAMLTHRNLLLNAWLVSERMTFTEADRLCIPVPLYHCFGCVLGVLVALVRGAAMVFPSESFDPLATLQAIRSENCTGLHGVPTMFIAELNHPRFDELRPTTLRTGIMAGSPCPIEVMRAVVGRMGATQMTIAYGLTEASPIITQTEPTDDVDHRVGTVGTALPGQAVRIVRPGTMSDVVPGEPGELIVRGHGVMKGYHNKPAETAEALTPDGWLHSGDLAAQTPDGYYRITGRIKDMIIRGGENVYPREIEEYLYTHPSIADVQVVGVPDEKMGEEVCAWIRLKADATLTEEQLRDYCRGRIAHFKVPRYVAFVAEYPTTVTGKVQKFRLREMAVERFGKQIEAKIETA